MTRILLVLFAALLALARPAVACEAPALRHLANAEVVHAVHATLAVTALPDAAPRLAALAGRTRAQEEPPPEPEEAPAAEEEVDKESKGHWLLRHAAAGTLVGVGSILTIIGVPMAIFSVITAIAAPLSYSDGYGIMGLFLGILGVIIFVPIAAIGIGMIAAGVRIGRSKKRKERKAALLPTGNGLALVGRF